MQHIERRASRYVPGAVTCGIVHLGLGAFHRAHQAVYVEAWLNKNNGGAWGITAANIRSNRAVVTQLNARGGRFHVVEHAAGGVSTVREVCAIREALYAGDDAGVLLERMAAPTTRIVTLTVSEKGYYLAPAADHLLDDDPVVRHDIEQPQRPRTAPGLVLEALRRRRAAGVAPFTVVSCDNMPVNGARTALAVAALAEHRSRDLADWVRGEVAFPNAMVDRIVPAMTPTALREAEALIGEPDPVSVVCEAFSQWVIEDRFPEGRPDWESVGVQMVADVTPYETMKLRLLNGAHSLLAYVGLLRGHGTVADAIADPALHALVRQYFAEVRRSLAPLPDYSLDDYLARLLERFANEHLHHRLTQIAMDGSQKIPQRWLEAAAHPVAGGDADRRSGGEGGAHSRAEGVAAITAIGVAAWMHHVSGRRPDGHRHAVDDPMAMRFARLWDEARDAALFVDALFAVREVFPERLAGDAAFRARVHAAYAMLARGELDRNGGVAGHAP